MKKTDLRKRLKIQMDEAKAALRHIEESTEAERRREAITDIKNRLEINILLMQTTKERNSLQGGVFGLKFLAYS